MLPEDWQWSTLGEIARISSGGTPDRSEPSYWGGSIPWVTTGEIQFNTINDTKEKITEAGLRNSSAKFFPKGSLLMAMYGQGRTRGQIAKLGIDATTNQACAAILIDKRQDSDFYFQYLSSQYAAIRELGNAGTQQNLNAGILKAFSIPVPPPDEQKRIAKLLATWDYAIAISDQLLRNCRKQKDSLISSLLSSVTTGDWQKFELKTVSTRVQRRSNTNGPRPPILMISSGTGFVRQDEKYTRYMAGKSVGNYVLLRKGEFAYNKGNSKLYEFGCVFRLEDYECGLVPNVYVCFQLDERCDPQFYKYLFEADYLHDQLGARVNTGVRNNGLLNIRSEDFMRVEIPLPPLEAQRRIAQILELASEEINCRESILNSLRKEKEALMAQFLTGKRRLSAHEFEEIAA